MTRRRGVESIPGIPPVTSSTPPPPPPPPGGIRWPAREPVAAHEVEMLGISVMVTVLERMTPDERRRALAYLTDRYGEQT